MNLFEWSEKHPQPPAEDDGSILLNTRFGDKRITPLLKLNGLALHPSLENEEEFTITHVASGRSIVRFTLLVNQEAATDFMQRFAELDFDAWWRTGKPENMAQQFNHLFRQWAEHHYGFTPSFRASPSKKG